MAGKLVILFNEAGKPMHAATKEDVDGGGRKFLCGRDFPEFFVPKDRHVVDGSKVQLRCIHCEMVREWGPVSANYESDGPL